MKLRSLSLQESAALAERLKTDAELKAALIDARACASSFIAVLTGTDAGILAFAAERSPSTAAADDVQAVKGLATMFRDWTRGLEDSHEATRKRCTAGRRELELEILGASQRMREIADEVPKIDEQMLLCNGTIDQRRAKLERVGVPHVIAAQLHPTPDRTELASRRVALLDESEALSRFLRTFSVAKLPASFGPWFSDWKARCGIRESEAEAA